MLGAIGNVPIVPTSLPIRDPVRASLKMIRFPRMTSVLPTETNALTNG